MTHSRFSAETWEATNIAYHLHPDPKIQKQVMDLRDDMHDYELHLDRQQRIDKSHKVPDPPDVTMRLAKVLGDSTPVEVSHSIMPLEYICRMKSLDVAHVRSFL